MDKAEPCGAVPKARTRRAASRTSWRQAVPVTFTGSLSQAKPWAFTLPARVDPRPRKGQQGNGEGPRGTCCSICGAGGNVQQWDPWLRIDQGRPREGPRPLVPSASPPCPHASFSPKWRCNSRTRKFTLRQGLIQGLWGY